MAATYTNTLPTNKDHVRFLISDTDTAAPLFQDEEITATLDAETATGAALKFYAAARLLDILRAKWASKGKGIEEKQVAKLRIRYGSGADVDKALAAHASELRKRGAFLLTPGSKVFKAL